MRSPQALPHEQPSFANSITFCHEETATDDLQPLSLFTTRRNELYEAEMKCIQRQCQTGALQLMLDNTKIELEELEKKRTRQRANCWEAFDAPQRYTYISDVSEETNENSSSEADVDKEPGAKKAKRAHVAMYSQLPDAKTIELEAILSSLS